MNMHHAQDSPFAWLLRLPPSQEVVWGCFLCWDASDILRGRLKNLQQYQGQRPMPGKEKNADRATAPLSCLASAAILNKADCECSTECCWQEGHCNNYHCGELLVIGLP